MAAKVPHAKRTGVKGERSCSIFTFLNHVFMKTHINTLLLAILSLTCQYSHAQSKKEQIEALTMRTDSLMKELVEQATSYSIKVAELSASIDSGKNQITALNEQLKKEKEASTKKIEQLNASIASTDKEIKLLAQQLKAARDSLFAMESQLGAKELYILQLSEENTELKSQLEKLNSAKNVDVGDLLTPQHEPADGSDPLSDFLFNQNTIQLPFPEDWMNYNSQDILPVGWNADGVFAYFSVPFNPCGLCGVVLYILDIKTNKILEKKEYDFQNLYDSEQGTIAMVRKMESDKGNALTRYGLTPISKLKSHYKALQSNVAMLGDIKIELTTQSGKAVLYKSSSNGSKSILHEMKLKKEYNEFYERWCEDFADLDGYFVNPLNQKQIILRLFQATPCGFEMETDYDTIFIPINL